MKNTGESESNGQRQPRLPYLPKKVAAAVRNVPFDAPREQLPLSFRVAEEKATQNIGSDFVDDYAQVFKPLFQRLRAVVPGKSVAEMLDHWSKMMYEIACKNATFSATVPVVLASTSVERPELIGSGVLLQIVNRTFLLTAAHVMDQGDSGTLMIPGKNGFMPLSGRFASMSMPGSGRRPDNNLDIAYFWLDNDCVAELHSECAILDRNDVSLEGTPKRRTTYTFAGYPWRKSSVEAKSIATSFYTFEGIEAKEDEYKSLGLTRSLHIAVRFHRKRTYKHGSAGVLTAPSLEGMSGGGIYAWTEDALKIEPVRLPLAGVAHTHKADRALLIGTRLHAFVRCIFRNQPELADLAT